MGDVYAIVSGKGGTGKTMLSKNLAAALNSLYQSVLILDCDYGLRTSDMAFGITESTFYNLHDVLLGKCNYKDAVIRCNSLGKTDIIPAPQAKFPEDFPMDHLPAFIEEVKRDYDYIFFDCQPGIAKPVRGALANADYVILVANEDIASLRACERLKGMVMDCRSIKETYLIVNMFHGNESCTVDEIKERLGVELIGLIPYEQDIKDLTYSDIFISENKQGAGYEITNTAMRLNGHEIPLPDTKNSFFKKLTGKR